MNANLLSPTDARALFSSDGTKWSNDKPLDWSPDERVTKIVIGQPPKRDPAEDEDKAISLAAAIPADLAERFPNLSHLYLWRIRDLRELPALPAGLKCLDVRGCRQLPSLPKLPGELETLVLDGCDQIIVDSALGESLSFPALTDISLRNATGLAPRWINGMLSGAPVLVRVDLSRCSQLTKVDSWPDSLQRIDLNDCENLSELLAEWPRRLRRLGLRNTGISGLNALPTSLDYLDLAGSRNLSDLPTIPETMRTLFIFNSGLQLPPELFGENEEANVAPHVIAYLAEQEHGVEVDHEVKVILLGDGRCGKSSLARRLIANQFDPKEESTHGIRLWEMNLDFEPVDEPKAEATAQLNIWDFAGQDLYHNTHRLFLQSKAVYVICWTDHGDGADAESDQKASDHLEMGEDQRRDLNYWQDQIAALGHASGMEGPPPVLIVRTKCDRDSERAGSAKDSRASHDKNSLELSAKTDAGINELKQRLKESVAEVLGSKRRRAVGRPMGVKHALQILKDRNQAAYLASEPQAGVAEDGSTKPRVRPPHSFVTRTEFDDLVREHCPDGDYHRDPGLLLDFLHQSGFLYYNAAYLPERVILDQRWAINGIYTIFHREKCWKQLRNAKGRFTASELHAWVWDDEGFDVDEQALFLEFMQACGICFLLLRDSETEGKEAVFLAPSALPDADVVRSEAAGHRGALPIRGEPLVLAHETLSRDSVLQLLVQLGREWRRAPVLWKWGGQFQSYRTERLQGDLTFMHLDWRPFSAESYGGSLTLTQYGPDETFLAAILAECEKLDGFRQVELPKIAIADPYKDRWERSGPEPDLERHEARPAEARSLDAHKPSAAEATAVEVGISYAGDHGGGIDDWTLLPDGSIEKWPRALAATLRAVGFKVDDYRTEQDLPEHEKTQACKAYLDKLTSRDFLVAFLSGKYLESPWCMYELMRIYKRMPSAAHDARLLRIGAFPDARFSQSNLQGEEAQRGKRFRDYWREQLQEFQAHIVQNADNRSDDDIYAFAHEAASYAYNEWMEFVRDDASLNNLIAALRGEWKCIGIDLEPSEEDLQKWAEETAANTDRPEVMIEYAIAARTSDKREHAKELLHRAYKLKAASAGHQDLIRDLKQSTGNPTLDDIRRELLEDLERQE